MNFETELQRLDSLASIHVTLDLPLCMRALALYLDPNQYSASEMAVDLGISERKLRAVREWLILMGLLQTERGRSLPSADAGLYSRIYDNEPDAFLELVYYRLCTRNRLFSGLVNVFLADRVRRFGRSSFATEDAKNWFVDFFLSTRSENDLKECFLRFFSPLLRLADGFGALSLLEKRESAYLIHAHTPHPLVQAYLLFDQAQGRASLPLNDVADGFNSLGRIFFLDRTAVLECLILLEATGKVQVDTTAGINQVALARGITPLMLLEELANGS